MSSSTSPTRVASFVALSPGPTSTATPASSSPCPRFSRSSLRTTRSSATIGAIRAACSAGTRRLSGLDVDEVGYFFFTLLPLRLAQVLKERLVGGQPAAATGLVTWAGGRASAEMLRRVLVCDASVALWLKRIGIVVPGLSNFAVCRKSV